AVAVGLVCYTFLRVFGRTVRCTDVDSWCADLRQHPENLAAPVILILFPPFLALCQFRFDVYEEAAAYAYLYGILVLAGTVHFTMTREFMYYVLLSLAAGLAAFFRPTLVFYGVASMLIAWWHTRGLPWARWKPWV